MYLLDLRILRREPEAIERGIEFTAAQKPKLRLAAALGSFDGVHLGHAALIGRAIKVAADRSISSAVFTFTEDSSSLPGKLGSGSLTPLVQKLSLIASLGVDYALLEDFSHIRDYFPEKFVDSLRSLGVECAVCGFNFRFGKGGSGDHVTLERLMPDGGCIVLPPYCIDGRLVSSSLIRSLIERGEVEQAETLLGHPFSVDLPVVHGKQLGRTIGIPTINQNFPERHIIPLHGIYACSVTVDDRTYPAVANIGVRPTVDGDSGRVNCETHIIGFSGWLYGKRIKVDLKKRLRDEMKFSGIDELRAQIARDIDAAVEFFAG